MPMFSGYEVVPNPPKIAPRVHPRNSPNKPRLTRVLSRSCLPHLVNRVYMPTASAEACRKARSMRMTTGMEIPKPNGKISGNRNQPAVATTEKSTVPNTEKNTVPTIIPQSKAPRRRIVLPPKIM